MKILLLGNGGREAALAWKISQSPLVTELICVPGNPGIAKFAQCIAGDPSDPRAVTTLALQKKIDLVVVGPEAPLMAGVADALSIAGVPVFGPSAAAANIEGSKAFAKEVMIAAKVPTARYEAFTDVEAASHRAREWGAVVVKADGLAAGKGVVVAEGGAEAEAAVRLLATLPGGNRLILEEKLSGPELSVIALCDGERVVLLPPAQDHKRLLEGDLGPNTGGMGTWAPAPLLTDAQLEALKATVFLPTLAEMKRRGTPFRGALFAGLMLTEAGPMVLEFNARFGDPETQSIMMMLADDLVPALLQCAKGALEIQQLAVHTGVVVTVVAAASGYPNSPRAGDAIAGLESLPAEAECFQAGTRRDAAGVLRTAGGRVLAIAARGPDVRAARERAYTALKQVTFDGMQFRSDIAHAGLKK